MRHRHTGRSFKRTSSHRKAMFANLCNSLVEHEIIKTTLPKAKELRRYIEPLITKSKSDSVASRRYIFDRLRSKSSVGKLFTELGPRYMERPGGYVRVLKCGYRYSDNAPMAIIELVGRPENLEDDFETDLENSLEVESSSEQESEVTPEPSSTAGTSKDDSKSS